MKRKCTLCEKDYELTTTEVQYLVKVKMIHPFFVCKDCAVLEVNSLAKDKQTFIIGLLGNPDKRKTNWDEMLEQYPEIRSAYVMNELDIQ